jgi:hypothetical protein
MSAVQKNLKDLNSKIIFITPSIYDQTAKIKTHNYFGVNDALAKCAEYVKESARKLNSGYVDFHQAMGIINGKIQKNDPSATIIGPDRVHPRPDPGHFIMAYQFLKAQALPKYVSQTVIDSKKKSVIKNYNCTISNVEVSSQEVSFTSLAKALPYPQTESIAKGLALIPFTKDFNQEILQVKNLREASYTLLIDNINIGEYSAVELDQGINIASNNKTPQYQQALKIQKLNDTRNYLQSQLRDVAFTFYSSGLYKADIAPKDTQTIQNFLDKRLEAAKGKSSYNYLKKKFNAYFATQAKRASIQE